MDTSVNNITFDAEGICNYCREAEANLPKFQFTEIEENENLQRIAAEIKNNSKGEYDSIIGLSGGVDSSYIAYLAWQMGLNPLCVHFDNGWNSETAVSNIKKIIDRCKFDLITYVINWPEFRDLQRAFLKAGVVDIEILTDHAHRAATLSYCKNYRINYVLAGNNYATEHGMPKAWAWNKQDALHIKAIHKKFGQIKLKTYPFLSNLQFIAIQYFKTGPHFIQLLNNVNYKKKKAMEVLHSEFDWEYYGGKHYESIFTKFYQAYILPIKFKIDKRKVHLSALIRNEEITREKALKKLEDLFYDGRELRRDKEFVLKKLGFTSQEFDEIMAMPPVPHENYPSELSYLKPLLKLGNVLFKRDKK
jgi:N-acetyl sugar amidotransferase